MSSVQNILEAIPSGGLFGGLIILGLFVSTCDHFILEIPLISAGILCCPIPERRIRFEEISWPSDWTLLKLLDASTGEVLCFGLALFLLD